MTRADGGTLERQAPGVPPIIQFIEVSTTCGSREDADRIAAAVVAERLAACAQVQGPISSTFRWEGRVDGAIEWSCRLKTTADGLGPLITRIKSLHTYECPEVIAVPIVGGSAEFLTWIKAQVSDPPP